MGNMVAAGFAEAVEDGLVTREAAIRANFASNFFPPLPGDLAPVVVEALEAVEAGEPERVVVLPETRIVPRMAWRDEDGTLRLDAETLVGITRTAAFLR